MKYLLLIYDNEESFAQLPEPDLRQMYGDYAHFGKSIRESGQYQASGQLQPTATAITVRVRDGKQLVTDGPFAETREQLGGFFLVDAHDRDEALAIASRIPSARRGSIEVRPLVEMSA